MYVEKYYMFYWFCKATFYSKFLNAYTALSFLFLINLHACIEIERDFLAWTSAFHVLKFVIKLALYSAQGRLKTIFIQFMKPLCAV